MKTIYCLKLCLGAAVLASHQLTALGQDIMPPTLVSASSADGARIGLCYSEAMDAVSTGDKFYYQVMDGAGSALVSGITLRPDGRSVMIDLSRPVTGEFTIEVNSVTDLAGNEIAPGSTVTGRVWTTLTLADIGGVLPAGSVVACNEAQFTVITGGENIGGTADGFTYLYASRTNNFDVQVRVDGLLFVGQATAKAGIHIRESLDANSPFFMAYVTPTNGANQILARTRSVAGQTASDFVTGLPVDTFPVWLRVKRAGVTLTAYHSRDGRNWSELGRALNMPLLPPVVRVGLGTVSRANGTATTADYQDFMDTALYTNALITLTQQPTNAVVEEHTRATFAVGASITGAPAADLGFQWQAETSPGSGVFTNAYWATGRNFSTPFLSAADSGTRFRVLVSLSGRAPVVSELATVTVTPDVTGPRAITATGTRSLREIVVEFSEPLQSASAQEPMHYIVAGFTVTNTTLDASGSRVLLALNAPQVPGSTNVVQISGVRDLAGHLIGPDPQSIPAPAFIAARGFVRQELYIGIGRDIALASLRAAPIFPGSPNDTGYAPLLEGPTDAYEEYGTRLSGFLAPTVTTNYHFFIASDDQGEFWLSTDEAPANLVLLCREPEWNPAREWTSTAQRPGLENRSATLFPAGIPLAAGRLYYFEALAKEGGGGDNLAVAWQMPGMALPASGSSPISGEHLALLVPPGNSVQILEQPRDIQYEFSPPPLVTVHTESFGAGDGGYTVAPGTAQEPWAFNVAGGSWFVNGSGTLNTPSSSSLTSPPFIVPRSGPLTLRFVHRYSFEYDGVRWDGGQMRLSVNGGPFQPVGTAGFCSRGYDGNIRGTGALFGQMGFNGDSPGYASGNLITSVARLGHFNAGDSLRIQFLAAWDDIIRGSLPNWLIDQVELAEGDCAGPVTFSVLAEASLPGVLNQEVRYQWQRDCGSGFSNIVDATAASYSFVPAPADILCQFRCVASVPGMSVTSTVARLTITPPQMAIRREGPNIVITWTGAGTLQNAQNVSGPWLNAGGATSNRYTIRPTADLRFYRLRVP